jgi:UDP-glucose:(heptosyl)LPS alpha-1,3-glucosyltransferase
VHTPLVDVPASARFVMPRHVALLALERRYFSDARLRAVLATSSTTAEELTRIYGVAPGLVAVMPNGFDGDEFDLEVRSTQRAEQRRRLGVEDDVMLLFVANELHRKGFDTLVDAVARVGDRRVRVDLVGRADPRAYRDRIAALGLTDRVVWHGPQRDMAPWYAAADLLVLPTRYEPFGNVVVEALACGLPVITTAVAGASVAVQPGVNGLLHERPDDAGELAGLLRTALVTGQLDQWAGGTSGIARFEWSVVTQQLVDVVIGLAAETATPTGPAR